jgi:SAM-dependent methyltransferase
VSDHYNQPQLAVLYDDENGWDASAEFYLELGRRIGATSLLDLGCGTGTVTRGIASRLGIAAVGVDPATPMLDVARGNTAAEQVEWIEGDARTIRLGRRFDLIIMTGHAFQGLATAEDQAACLATMAAHLSPNGRLAFDSRNPAAQEWLEWQPNNSARVLETRAHGAVEIWNEAHLRADGVTLDTVEHYRVLADDRRWRSDFVLRFTPQPDLAAAIAAAGLTVETWLGTFDGAPFTPGAREIIPVCRLPG